MSVHVYIYLYVYTYIGLTASTSTDTRSTRWMRYGVGGAPLQTGTTRGR